MSDVIQGDGFTLKANKFDFFFGHVTSNTDNQRRSIDNLNGLRQLGIEEEYGGREQLLQIFHQGLNSPQVGGKRDRYGTTIVRKVEIVTPCMKGAIEISYLYRNNDMDSIPEVTTLITNILVGGNMNIQPISQAEFNRIEGVRRIIVHDCAHQFAILYLGENLGIYGLSWRSSSIIQPVITLSKDERTLWVGVDQRLAAIDLQNGHICLSMSLHTPLFQILALDNCTVVLTELDVLLFNNSDCSIRSLEGLPEIAADMIVNGSDLWIELIDENRLILNLDSLELKDQSTVFS